MADKAKKAPKSDVKATFKPPIRGILSAKEAAKPNMHKEPVMAEKKTK